MWWKRLFGKKDPEPAFTGNKTPMSQPQSPGQQAVAALITAAPDAERAFTILHYGLNGNDPLPIGQLCAMTRRSLAEVGSTLHAMHVRVRNNAKFQAAVQVVLEEGREDAADLAQCVADQRLEGTTPRQEALMVKGWLEAQHPLVRFCIHAVYDHPLDYAYAALRKNLEDHLAQGVSTPIS